MPWLVNIGYKAVQLDQYEYIHWLHYDGVDELYDLEADPFECHNVIDDPKYQQIKKLAQEELTRLVVEAHGLP